MASNEDELLAALIRKRPNTQPLHARSSQPFSSDSSRPVLPDATHDSHSEDSRNTLEAPEESEERVALSAEDRETSTSASSRLTSPSVEEFTFPLSQYRPQTILKRKFSEDLTNFAEDQARLNGLHGLEADDVVRRFAHYTLEQKLIALYASNKRQKADIERMYKAASGPWAPSNALLNKIRKFSFLVLANPAISWYTGEKPLEHVMNILRKYPRIGFTSEMAADEAKQSVVEKLISEQLIVVRNEFKTIIQKFTLDEGAHRQKDIHSLCRAFLAAKAKVAPKLQLTINMAACFAFLRSVFLVYSGHRYWNRVDKLLGSMREKYSKDDISECFSASLDEDQAKYPLLGDDATAPELPCTNFAVEDHIDESESIIACF
ncbi:hypothetical protein AGABI2DRAFT_144350 [Agaricus bisporus var. bisporus H97]|uniref:hypothetical protein n=1 Tax=Agaricus bisporus var. bisporus (strain H97 / ATCC MYA-4626 / FGSC 10389) TaxID=936046 RepID=UPI00029F6BDC|nr:hypothetical protein AGABI2DRAFT_144350 [Agaricus bisporus var. bisporus H97]EKV46083.1 hypothetical protein AGABI2DRAFT_144350 [Agaricus bisporus var. bisporus H97]